MNYLSEDQEAAVVRAVHRGGTVELQKVIEGADLVAFAQVVRGVKLSPTLGGYIVDLVASSRPSSDGCPQFIKDYVAWGAGLRGQPEHRACGQVLGAQDGRDAVNIADIRKAVLPVLRHRIGLSFRARWTASASRTW